MGSVGRRTHVLIVAGLLVAALAFPGWAAPGDPDTAFGRRGKVTTNFTSRDDMVFETSIQADGKIVAAGTAGFQAFALTRYRRDGTVDPSFGDAGKIVTSFAPGITVDYGVAIQPDGRIVAAGSAHDENQFALARYNADGALDPSFDGDGKVTATFTDDHDFALDVAIQSDGRIVAAGTGSFAQFGVMRFDADGSLDGSFGEAGKVLTDLTGGLDVAFAVAIQDDGKIVAAGRAAGAGGRFALVRYKGDGTLDGTFGEDGVVTTNFTRGHDAVRDVLIQADGRIVAAGRARGAAGRFALARYRSDGTPDPTFGRGGKVLTDFSPGLDLALGLAIQTNGRIVAAGHAGGPNHSFAVARYLANGRLDRSFADGGKETVDFTPGDDFARDVAIQRDGKIVMGGRSNRAGGSFALARLEAR
ncbi:MAG: hypothetical protein ACRDHV_11790 [Actinomycetota bacterium]